MALDGELNAAQLDNIEREYETHRFRAILRGPKQERQRVAVVVRLTWKEKAALEKIAKPWLKTQVRTGKIKTGFGKGTVGLSTFIRAALLKLIPDYDAEGIES